MHAIRVGKCDLGWGVFAARAFRTGEVVLQLTGRVISLDEMKARGELESYPLQISQHLCIDLEYPGMYVNHSCEPNSFIHKGIFLAAARDIAEGEEIRYDYSSTMYGDDWTMPCSCKSQTCRGIVTEFFKLEPSQQKTYVERGWVAEFIFGRWSCKCLPKTGFAHSRHS
jgi:uncharacterized protein